MLERASVMEMDMDEEIAEREKQYAALEKRYNELFEAVEHLLAALKVSQKHTEELLSEKRKADRGQ